MKKALALFLFLLFMASPVWATDYYVNADAVSNGNGLTPETAANTLWTSQWAFVGDLTGGDTVYIGGTWATGTYNKRQLTTTYQAIAGSSPSSHLTLDGNYPDNPCRIVAMVYVYSSGWTDEEDGTWSREFTTYSTDFEFALEDADDTDQDILRVDTLEACQSTAGTFFMDTETDTLYYHPTTGGANDHLFSIGDQNAIAIATGSKYLTIKNFTLRGGNLSVGGTDSDYLTIEYNNIKYVDDFAGINFPFGAVGAAWGQDHILVQYNTIEYVPVGIYFLTNTDQNWHEDIEVCYNTIKNTGTKNYTAEENDDHGIAFQGGINVRIHDNYIENTGFAITSYAYGATSYEWSQPTKDFKVYRNFCKTGHDFGGNTNAGIQISVYNSQDTQDTSGNEFYENIIDGFTVGVRPASYNEAHYYNNVIRNCTYAVRSGRNSATNTNSNFRIWNNIIADCTYGFYNGSGATTGYTYDFRYNLYTTGTLFKTPAGDLSFAEWVASSAWGDGTLVPDSTGSLVGDPDFLNAGGSFALDTDYKIGASSDAINAGTSVSATLTEDYFGTSIPQDGQSDIGIHEYFTGETPPDINIQTGVSFTGVGMQ